MTRNLNRKVSTGAGLLVLLPASVIAMGMIAWGSASVHTELEKKVAEVQLPQEELQNGEE